MTTVTRHSLYPLRVLQYVTCVIVKMHNTNRKQDGVHGEAIDHRLSVDMALFSKKTVPFSSVYHALCVVGVQ